MNPDYRLAVPEDIDACVDLRGRTRENAFSVEQLRALGITADSWRAAVEHGELRGHVCCIDLLLVGYCFADVTGEIVVLAVLPEWEGRGIGRHLLERALADLAAHGFTRMFLGCSTDPATRSYSFYRHLGWQSTGQLDAAGDEILEYLIGSVDPNGSHFVSTLPPPVRAAHPPVRAEPAEGLRENGILGIRERFSNPHVMHHQ